MTYKEQIQNIAAKLHITERRAWEMYYESGIDYIEQLKKSMVHFKIFKAQFGGLIQTGALDNLSVPETFRLISVASEFWEWWLIQQWAIANNNYKFQTIPSNITYKIFQNDTKINNRRKRVAAKPSHSACEA